MAVQSTRRFNKARTSARISSLRMSADYARNWRTSSDTGNLKTPTVQRAGISLQGCNGNTTQTEPNHKHSKMKTRYDLRDKSELAATLDSPSCVIFASDDVSELYHIICNRGFSSTRAKLLTALRELDGTLAKRIDEMDNASMQS